MTPESALMLMPSNIYECETFIEMLPNTPEVKKQINYLKLLVALYEIKEQLTK